MKIYNLREKQEYLNEVMELCIKEWGSQKSKANLTAKIQEKANRFLNCESEAYDTLVLADKELIGFISLFKTDGDEYQELTPWYATMYVKGKYRGLGYSKILNNAILEYAKEKGFSKIYLKTDLTNYYEKFGAIYINELKNGEKLYYINL